MTRIIHEAGAGQSSKQGFDDTGEANRQAAGAASDSVVEIENASRATRWSSTRSDTKDGDNAVLGILEIVKGPGSIDSERKARENQPMRIAILFMILVPSVLLPAQSRLFTFHGAGSISTADRPEGRDTDGDGVPDLLVTTDKGEVELRSGASGAIIRVFNPVLASAPSYFGATSALIDVTGDGLGEIVLGEPGFMGAGRVSCWSAAGQLLFQWNAGPNQSGFGGRIVPAGDVDGDGLGDVFIGYLETFPPATSPTPQFRAFRTGGASLITWTNPPISGQIPVQLRSAGDVDGDGLDETAVAFLGTTARIVEPATASTIHAITAPYSASSIENLVSVGDVDADGVPDLAISGRPQFSFGGPNGPSDVVIHSGATGALIRTISNGDIWDFGKGLAALGDVDGDGVPELAVSGSDLNSPFVTAPVQGGCLVYSGATGGLVASILGPPGDGAYATYCVSIGDLDGNGVAELMILNPTQATVEVWSIASVPTTASALPFGEGGGASLPPSLSGSPPVIGTTASLTVSGAPAVLYDFLFGGVPAAVTQVPGGPSWLDRCPVYVDLSLAINYGSIGLGSLGSMTIFYSVPSSPALAGFAFVLQGAVYPITGGFVSTNALMLTLGS